MRDYSMTRRPTGGYFTRDYVTGVNPNRGSPTQRSSRMTEVVHNMHRA